MVKPEHAIPGNAARQLDQFNQAVNDPFTFCAGDTGDQIPQCVSVSQSAACQNLG
jgi:hypothetical protein